MRPKPSVDDNNRHLANTRKITKLSRWESLGIHAITFTGLYSVNHSPLSLTLDNRD